MHMAPRIPEEGSARGIIRSTRLAPDLDAQFARRMRERKQTPTTYLRSLVRADVEQNPEKSSRGNARTES